MQNLTPEEQATISRYLADRRSRADIFLHSAIYFVPSLLFGLYGMWKGDIGAMALAYVVLVGLVVYLILQQARTSLIWRSVIRKLVKASGMPSGMSAKPISSPSE